MERLRIEPRPNWTREVEALGFDFYTIDGVPYWGEDACYRFTAAEVDIIEEAANKLHKLCLYAVQRIVDMRLFPLLGIDPEIGRLITESWARREPAVYGRFDLIYDGATAPKLLEYNADTPTSLFEASIVQWNWREQRFPEADQFNSIHENQVARWRSFLVGRRNANRLHVTCATPMPEDETTVQYIGATAQEAGYRAKFLPIQEVGWDEGLKRFVDLDGEPIPTRRYWRSNRRSSRGGRKPRR
jgi:glutathionylspermidine synthase